MYTVRQAKAYFSKLLRKPGRGKRVIMPRGKTPVAKLVGLRGRKKKRVPGRLKGKIWYTPDVFDPLTKKELSEWGIE